MNQTEFINKMIGVPWVNRASSFDKVDCFGLVMLYYKQVLGINLPTVTGYCEDIDTAQCWTDEIHRWTEVDKPSTNGLVFTCYRGDRPTHVGIVISPTKVMHCRGSEIEAGSVAIHTIRAIQSIYGKMTYHKFIGLQQCQKS